MSNLIKSNRYISVDEIRKLEAFVYHPPKQISLESADSERDHRLSEAERAAAEILGDAKAAAEEQLQMAAVEAERLKAEAAETIEQWWAERRAEDARAQEEARQAGYEAGFQEGLRQAEEQVRMKHEAMLQEAARLVTDAHRVKDAIIAESEPFLVELATAIARKIIGAHLSVDEEWTARKIRETLAGRRDKGHVTLCVAPSQFTKLQDARAELALSLDSEAELAIVPDATVDEGGCVVRTAFGSVDARIDTQLSEIKAALMEVASQGSGRTEER